MSKQVLRKDPTGYPDWTLPVSIIAQLIETLKVDISAQTLSQLNVNIAAVSETVTFNVEVQNAYLYVRTEAGQNLTVDIAAQSLSALNINIAGSTTTLEVTNPEGQNLNVAVQDSITLNVQITGSSITLPVHEQGTANVSIQSSVTLDVNITGSSISVPVTNPSGQSLDVSITSSTTLNVQIVGSNINVPISVQEPLDASGNVNVAIQASTTLNVNITGSTTTLEVTNPAGQNLNVAIQDSITINMNITGSTITVPVETPEGSHVDVEIIQSITLNVNITGQDVTLNVNIASSSVAINIKTETGANIIIDKLTATAYKEERRIIANNGPAAVMRAPGTSYRRGKYFPRGCRGFINKVEVYCDNQDTADHKLYVYVSPQPGMAPIISAELTVAAEASPAWRAVTIRQYWNYDSLFVWVLGETSSYPRVGYDTGEPYDYYISSDGITWMPGDNRWWIRLDMAGQTVGDLPVTGTINTVEVPGASSRVEQGITTVPANQEVTLIEIEGSGKMLSCFFHSQDADIQYRVYCDGQLAEGITGGNLWAYGFTASTPGLSLLQYDDTNLLTRIFDTRPFEFKYKLKITAKNLSSVDGLAYAWASVALKQ